VCIIPCRIFSSDVWIIHSGWVIPPQGLGISVIILLNILSIPLTCTSSPSSIPMILWFGLLRESLSSYIFLSQLLSCLTKSSSVFSLISVLSSSFEILSSTCYSLLEWISTVFFV
jgi:hypothetical protein